MLLARPGLPEFDYLKAQSPQQVFQLMEEKGSDLKLLLGGTDLFIQMRDHGQAPDCLLDLKDLPGIREILFSEENGLRIGAAATLNEVCGHDVIQARYPALCQAADTVGNYQLRNRATLGGNICNASPSADTSPALLIYEGKAVIKNPAGERILPLRQFWTGPGTTALEALEYLQGIQFPLPPENTAACYLKLGRTRMGDLAVVGVAVMGYSDPESPSGFGFRIGINSTAPTAYRVPPVEKFLSQNTPGPETFRKAADGAREISAPIEDQRATAAYQKEMVSNLVYQGLVRIWEELK